ncbi:AbrB/MazE/SpoVT family DNA-binding domain-containing protein [Azospirillum rugosum]|uniref:AbrB family looped-hinge helix DNA binding protein n=1 Tax=Azospirillum rugosum TaxID=416170 RepID=A0ABS4SLG8_9PROT|nr:AbrB/MazE/SpoVT family DNA-binding domain-containing protein [Azospirillum rugosum]MBP2292255.1 AbrB family looped-hinge helix DNA binding protein [Azospirillum rugosum]MDQ0526014.1 AbrB family looped-hinge helix DNA binding protein [Azospirillum rugosum]
MGYIRVGPNGELPLPQDLRDQLGVKPGDRVELVLRSDRSIVVRPRPHTLEDLIGCGGTFERAVTQEEMDEAIRQQAVERFNRSRNTEP